jgi:hypothetical protein
VSALIERNIREFSDLAVEFRCVDITADMLPAADVALVRQGLQHLNNASISKVAQRFGFPIPTLLFHLEEHGPQEPEDLGWARSWRSFEFRDPIKLCSTAKTSELFTPPFSR